MPIAATSMVEGVKRVSWRSSAKLGESVRYDVSVPEVRLGALAREGDQGRGQSGPERRRFERANVGTL